MLNHCLVGAVSSMPSYIIYDKLGSINKKLLSQLGDFRFCYGVGGGDVKKIEFVKMRTKKSFQINAE